MSEENAGRRRRTFRWPKEARAGHSSPSFLSAVGNVAKC